MSYFILLQYPYESLEIGLSHNDKVIDSISITKFEAVEQLIPSIETILTRNNKTIEEISGIGVNAGPGPFNTLRAIIATVNAITFTIKTPIIQSNALTLLHKESNNTAIPLLHAFGKDVYFEYKTKQGFANIDTLLQKIAGDHHESINFIGNGAEKYSEKIEEYFKGSAKIVSTQFNSLAALAQTTYEKHNNKETVAAASPFYLESPAIKKS